MDVGVAAAREAQGLEGGHELGDGGDGVGDGGGHAAEAGGDDDGIGEGARWLQTKATPPSAAEERLGAPLVVIGQLPTEEIQGVVSH